MTREYKKYGPDYFESIKPYIIQGMICRVTVKQMAFELDIKFCTLAGMIYKNGLYANAIRYNYNLIGNTQR